MDDWDQKFNENEQYLCEIPQIQLFDQLNPGREQNGTSYQNESKERQIQGSDNKSRFLQIPMRKLRQTPNPQSYQDHQESQQQLNSNSTHQSAQQSTNQSTQQSEQDLTKKFLMPLFRHKNSRQYAKSNHTNKTMDEEKLEQTDKENLNLNNQSNFDPTLKGRRRERKQSNNLQPQLSKYETAQLNGNSEKQYPGQIVSESVINIQHKNIIKNLTNLQKLNQYQHQTIDQLHRHSQSLEFDAPPHFSKYEDQQALQQQARNYFNLQKRSSSTSQNRNNLHLLNEISRTTQTQQSDSTDPKLAAQLARTQQNFIRLRTSMGNFQVYNNMDDIEHKCRQQAKSSIPNILADELKMFQGDTHNRYLVKQMKIRKQNEVMRKTMMQNLKHPQEPEKTYEVFKRQISKSFDLGSLKRPPASQNHPQPQPKDIALTNSTLYNKFTTYSQKYTQNYTNLVNQLQLSKNPLPQQQQQQTEKETRIFNKQQVFYHFNQGFSKKGEIHSMYQYLKNKSQSKKKPSKPSQQQKPSESTPTKTLIKEKITKLSLQDNQMLQKYSNPYRIKSYSIHQTSQI